MTDATDDAATQITHDEQQQLILRYITLRRELNAAEQANIHDAEKWAFTRRRDVLSETFLNELHRRMFGNVWRWAGIFRQTPRNIGVEPYRIAVELRQLLDDARYWINNQTYSDDEIATRFHHRLVFVHPYPNGNGRHARLATNLLLESRDRPLFTWGGESIVDAGQTRKSYVEALRAADAHNLTPLLQFVRS